MVKPKSISEIQRWVMENSYLEWRWRMTIHGAKQKRWKENQSLWSWCVEAEDWGYIYGEAQIYIINSKMGNGEQLPGIAMKNDDTRSKAKTLKREPILVKLMRWGRGLRIYMVKGEDWRRNGKGYIWFSAKKFGGIAICESRDTEIATGSCLSWNANFCWFQNAIPQISPSQTFPDFCDLINGRLALSIRLNKRALFVHPCGL